ncbi:hypothetical protein MTO96_012944 [Rhipicephalus appendiculatus]
MALLRSCCCWLSVRKGSFACGIYTLIFYTMLVATGGSHVSSMFHSPVVLLLALVFDNRLLLLPWLTIVPITTMLDVALSLYFIRDLKVNAFVIVMYIVDYTLCSINVYCILCVLSQYQMYLIERRTLGQGSRPSARLQMTPATQHGKTRLTPEIPMERVYGVEDTSSALHLSTAEASLQHSIAEAEMPETFSIW